VDPHSGAPKATRGRVGLETPSLARASKGQVPHPRPSPRAFEEAVIGPPPTAVIVLTTVHDSDILNRYFENLKQFGHVERVGVVVIPDRKTPRSMVDRCEELLKQGWRVSCPSLEKQEDYLRSLGAFGPLVPYDSDNRRNVGYLMALEQGTDYLISIDDDNFPLPGHDFAAEHAIVCAPPHEFSAVNSATGWFNICDMLRLEPASRVYPRGFPYNQRHQPTQATIDKERGVVQLNAGLWLSEPDLDAMTWLTAPVRAVGADTQSLVLGTNTWSPINTQNTGLHRDVIPSYYFVRMGYPVAGMAIDRYGDIFSGYFSQACVRHLGGRIRVGTPLADHRRNSHNLLADATRELACIWVLEELTAWLREVKLDGNSYCEAYESVSHAVEQAVERFAGFIWTDTTRGYFHQMAYCMRQWIRACRQLGAV
jgi:reversibly glycosylated polypeptide